jgi:hypothetical protein
MDPNSLRMYTFEYWHLVIGPNIVVREIRSKISAICVYAFVFQDMG